MHTSRPHAPAHSCLYSARDIQERRLVQSRSQSRPGQAREADSQLGPSHYEEHRSNSCSATPTALDQACLFLRMASTPSIADPTPQMPSPSKPPPEASPPLKPCSASLQVRTPTPRAPLPAPFQLP